MTRHRKVGRPKGSTKKLRKDNIVGCSKVKIFRMRKGRVQKIVGYKYKVCID